MTNIILFHFESNEIRFVGTSDNPLWVASDLCKALDVKNTSDALERLEEDEKENAVLNYTDASGIERTTNVLALNEPGMYSLVLSSRKPVAKRLKRWITREVLPSIRKTGSYSLDAARAELEKKFLPTPTLKQIGEVAKTLKAAGFKPSYIERITILNLQKHHPGLLPEAPQAQEMESLPITKLLMTPTQIGAALGWYYKSNATKGDARRVNKKLAELGYQEKIGDDWNPTSKAIDAKLADFKPVMVDGKKGNVDQLLWSADILPILQEHSEASELSA